MVKCLLNVARCCEVFVFELLRLSPTSIGLSSSLYCGVVENQSKHLKSPCLLYFITPQLVRECVPFSESRTESPNKGALFKASSKHCSSQPSCIDDVVLQGFFFFLFKLKTNEFLQVTYILNRLISGVKLQKNWKQNRDFHVLPYLTSQGVFTVSSSVSEQVHLFECSPTLGIYTCIFFFPRSLDFCLIHGF